MYVLPELELTILVRLFDFLLGPSVLRTQNFLAPLFLFGLFLVVSSVETSLTYCF